MRAYEKVSGRTFMDRQLGSVECSTGFEVWGGAGTMYSCLACKLFFGLGCEH